MFARLTASPEEILEGKLCSCTACTRDGQHEPTCAVHRRTQGDCDCGREDQAKGAS
jgi:hypothetical protein